MKFDIKDCGFPQEFNDRWLQPFPWAAENIRDIRTKSDFIKKLMVKYPTDTIVRVSDVYLKRFLNKVEGLSEEKANEIFKKVYCVVSGYESSGLIEIIHPLTLDRTVMDKKYLEIVAYRDWSTPKVIKRILDI